MSTPEITLSEILSKQPSAPDVAPALFTEYSTYPNEVDVYDRTLPNVNVLVSSGVRRKLNGETSWFDSSAPVKPETVQENLDSEYNPYKIAQVLGAAGVSADQSVNIHLFGPITGGFEFSIGKRISFGTSSGVMQEIREYRDFSDSQLYQIANSYLARHPLRRRVAKVAGLAALYNAVITVPFPPYNLTNTGINLLVGVAGFAVSGIEIDSRQNKAESAVLKTKNTPENRYLGFLPKL